MAETLYSRNGGYPAPCPQSGAEPNGTIWTDLPNNPEGRAARGLVAAPGKPAYDAGAETLDWIDNAWVVVDLPPPVETPIEIVRNDFIARINIDRDQRIEGGFVFEGHPYQTRQSDRENIVRKGDRAQRAIDLVRDDAEALEALEDDLTWDATTGGQPFVFLAGDNAAVPMDAFKMVALRDAGESFKQICVFVARGAKDLIAAAESAEDVAAIYDAIAWPPSEP